MQIVTYPISNQACIGAFFVNKVPSVAIAHRPARERAILVDPPRAEALGDQLRDRLVDIPRYLSLTGKISVDSSLSRAGRCTI